MLSASQRSFLGRYIKLPVAWRKVTTFVQVEAVIQTQWAEPADQEMARRKLRNQTSSHICITAAGSRRALTLNELILAFGDPEIPYHTNRAAILGLCENLEDLGLVLVHRPDENRSKYSIMGTTFLDNVLKEFINHLIEQIDKI